MNQQTPPSQTSTTHFDAAKTIVEALKGMPREQQALAIRFASETLGLQVAPLAQGLATIPHQPSGPGAPGATAASARLTDIKRFTATKAPKSDQQFAAVVAYYYRFEAPESDRKDAISADDLTQAARLVGRKRPHRVTLNNAKSAGYLDAAGRGRFQLNTVGENLVAVGLPGENAASADNPARKKRSKAKIARTPRRRKAAHPSR